MERKKAQRARIAWLCLLGVWLVVPAILWPVGPRDWGDSEFFRAPTPHETHLLSLGRSGLLELPAGRQWLDESYRAIDRPLSLSAAYLEEGFFPSGSSQALGVRLRIPAGQRATVEIRESSDSDLDLFLDLFRAAPDTLWRPVHLESGELNDGAWRFDSQQDEEYILRLQPKLHRGGRYRFTVRVGAPFRFPVAGAGESQIQSFFGDSREGGRREHHGVDIFMPRGTPVLAATDGTIRRVNETGLGGRVVWQRDAEGRVSIYYAHLDRQLVRRGQQVSEGDTIGLVGNTGNARRTPPHLHFGIYRRGRGPVDPWNFILPAPPPFPELTADPEAVQAWARTSQEGVRLRRSPHRQGDVLSELPLHSRVRVLAAAGSWYRVGFPGGPAGYISADLLEPISPSQARWADAPTPSGTRD